MRPRPPRYLVPVPVLLLLAAAGCGLPGIGPGAPGTTEAAPPPAASSAAEPGPAKSASAGPTAAASPTAGADQVTVTADDDAFRMILPPKWKVAPKEGGLDKVTVSAGGILKPNAAREQRNAVGYRLGAYVIGVRPAKNGGEPNVNIGKRDAGGVTDVGDLAGPGKQGLESFGATKIRTSTTTLGGDPALQLRSRLQQGEFELAITQYIVLGGDLAWITTITELADESSVAPQIADGLDFSV